MISIENILFSFIDAKRELQDIEGQIEMIRQDLMPKSPVISDMPKGHSQADRFAETMCKIDELQNDCDKARRKAIDRMEYVESIIDKVERPLYQSILRKRYILGNRWEVIATEMHYSMRHLNRLRTKALEEASHYIDDGK